MSVCPSIICIAQIGTVVQHMRSETMAEHVRVGLALRTFAHQFPDSLTRNMPATAPGKEPWRDSFLYEPQPDCEPMLHGLGCTDTKGHDAFLVALAANNKQALVQIQIRKPSGTTFGCSQSASVEQLK